MYTKMCKSFRGLWVKKIEFLAKNRTFYPHLKTGKCDFCKNSIILVIRGEVDDYLHVT